MQTSMPEPPHEAPARAARPSLIVFSHVRWTSAFQRLQQLMTRLAAEFDVHVVEEPVFADTEPALMSATHQNGVEVLTPCTREFAAGFHDSQLHAMAPLLADFVASRGLRGPLVWLTTPLAWPLVAALGPGAVVYDCMDDLAAQPHLAERERELMALADLVLAGTSSLHERREGRHPNLHFLPDGVDAAHFAPEHLDGDDPEGAVAAELHRGLPRPRLGFAGAIDEHLDLALVAALADRRPDWQIVLAGPVVGIDPAALPQRPNLHWAGAQRHECVPHLMSHWDACLLPLAPDAPARSRDAALALEALAAGRPVVATPLPDLVALLGAELRFAKDADEFVAAIEALLAEPAQERAARRTRERRVLRRHDWDATAATLAAMLRELAPVTSADPIVLHEALADAAPVLAVRVVDAVPVLTERVELPVPPLTM